MCTGLELAAMAAGAAGNVIEASQTRKQQDAMTAASNNRLNQFLDRNKKREDEAATLFDQRTNDMQPDAVTASQTNATQDRTNAGNVAIDSVAPAGAIPTKGSAATLIGDVYSSEAGKATAKAKDTAARGAKVSGFGDALFGQDLATADAGRRIGSVGALAADDAAMLPYYQDLAIAQAQAKHRPSGIGSLLRGLGMAGGSYAGSF